MFGRRFAAFGSWAEPGAGPGLARRFLYLAAVEGPLATRAGCEVSRALGPRLGLAPAAVLALDDVFERWDGLGTPTGAAGSRCR